MEAIRALKHRPSEVVYRQMILDHRVQTAGSSAQIASAISTAPDSHSATGTSDKSLPRTRGQQRYAKPPRP